MNIESILGNFTSKITDSVAAKAKTTALTTLNDPEIKAAVNKFAKDFFEENRVVIIAVVGVMVILSILAITNIITSFRKR